MGRWIFKSLLVLLVLVMALAGVVTLGRGALDQLRPHPRYQVAFRDIECTPPPGMSRQDFLDEVQYLAQCPDRLALLDEELSQHLVLAFARHPWVENVEQVEVRPPRQVQVRLVHRTGVLAVQSADGIRVVDAGGIVLPRGAPHAGLPRLEALFSSPRGPAGTRWGDPEIEAAARRAAQRRS
jgi:hypothetical protein